VTCMRIVNLLVGNEPRTSIVRTTNRSVRFLVDVTGKVYDYPTPWRRVHLKKLMTDTHK
jgi:hypothetical protein